jgi:hypothetical protein
VPWTLTSGALAGAAAALAALLAMGFAFRTPEVVAIAAGIGFAVALVVAGTFCAVAGVPLRQPRRSVSTAVGPAPAA